MRIVATVTAALVVALTTVSHTAAPAAAGSTTESTAEAADRSRTAASVDEPAGKLLLVLDASGSMQAKDPSGLTKIEAAKKALTGVVSALPDGAEVGLRLYGATVDGKGKPTPAACADTQLVAPIAPLDRPALTSAIAAVRALGETPIAYSLTQALTDLGADGKRNIVLVSDGEESCVPDPCPAVTKLTAAGVDLQIDTVGFGVDAAARRQLQCIADAGRGTYYDAKDAATLASSLGKLSQRALRPFTISGTPVSATSAPEQAPDLVPGQYTDVLTQGAAARYYSVRRAPGSTVRLSVTTRPPLRLEDYGVERLQVEVTLPDGTRCDGTSAYRFDPGQRAEAVVAAVSVLAPKDADDQDACRTAEQLTVSVRRLEGSAGDIPVEVLYVEEPAVTNLPTLPPAVEAATITPLVAPASGPGTPVVGGGGFSDALSLAPGTYTDVVLPGEQIFYRVRADFGQRVAMTVDAPAPGQTITLGSTSYTGFAIDAFNPWRHPLSRSSGQPRTTDSVGPSGTPVVIGEYVPQIRHRNREVRPGSSPYSYLLEREASLAGYYYFAVGRTSEKAGEDSAVPVTVRLRVAVEGEPTGMPAYAGPAPVDLVSPSTSASASTSGAPGSSPPSDTGAGADPDSSDDGSSPVGGALGGVAAVLLLGAGAVLLLLLRRRGARSG